MQNFTYIFIISAAILTRVGFKTRSVKVPKSNKILLLEKVKVTHTNKVVKVYMILDEVKYQVQAGLDYTYIYYIFIL